MSGTGERLRLDGVGKSFTLHLRGRAVIDVVADVSFAAAAGECVTLLGPSGSGKSSILKMIYGNYRADRGTILVEAGGERIDVAQAPPRRVLELRRTAIGYVSQFLRVIPRVATIDIVAAAALAGGLPAGEATARAGDLLDRLRIPRRLWPLPPATFSGGEQQRVNIARGFVAERPLLLLDEPTASLDAENREVVVDLVRARLRAGATVVGIFHDADVRDRLAGRAVDVTRFGRDRAA
jgi:alpha-D-ribose 1-methylphosphonate 5-triphosphate synthase subunit PhnL